MLSRQPCSKKHVVESEHVDGNGWRLAGSAGLETVNSRLIVVSRSERESIMWTPIINVRMSSRCRAKVISKHEQDGLGTMVRRRFDRSI